VSVRQVWLRRQHPTVSIPMPVTHTMGGFAREVARRFSLGGQTYSHIAHMEALLRADRFFGRHAHNLFTQFNLTLALLNSLSFLLPLSPSLSCFRLHQMIFTAKYVRVCLMNIRCFFVTYLTRIAYGLPPPTHYRHPTLNLEMPLMHPAPPPTPARNTTTSPSFPYSPFRL